MAETVSDFMVQRLYEWGVHRIYGYPGDGINGIMGALARAQDRSSLSKFDTRRWRPSWPAAMRSLRGKSGSASRPRVPAPFICSTVSTMRSWTTSRWLHRRPAEARRARGRLSAGVDLTTLFKDVAHEYVHVVTTAAQMRHLVDRALRIAKAERTVTCIVVPRCARARCGGEATTRARDYPLGYRTHAPEHRPRPG
jgi:pyruvate dehydrogenase (quinone)